MMIAAGSNVPTCPLPQGPTDPPVQVVVLTRSAIVASTVCTASAATLRNEFTRARPTSGDCLMHLSSTSETRASRSAIAVIVAVSATAISDPPMLAVALVLQQAAAADRLLDVVAFKAAGGQLTCGVVPIPSSISVKTFDPFRTGAAIVIGCSDLTG